MFLPCRIAAEADQNIAEPLFKLLDFCEQSTVGRGGCDDRFADVRQAVLRFIGQPLCPFDRPLQLCDFLLERDHGTSVLGREGRQIERNDIEFDRLGDFRQFAVDLLGERDRIAAGQCQKARRLLLPRRQIAWWLQPHWTGRG